MELVKSFQELCGSSPDSDAVSHKTLKTVHTQTALEQLFQPSVAGPRNQLPSPPLPSPDGSDRPPTHPAQANVQRRPLGLLRRSSCRDLEQQLHFAPTRGRFARLVAAGSAGAGAVGSAVVQVRARGSAAAGAAAGAASARGAARAFGGARLQLIAGVKPCIFCRSAGIKSLRASEVSSTPSAPSCALHCVASRGHKSQNRKTHSCNTFDGSN